MRTPISFGTNSVADCAKAQGIEFAKGDKLRLALGRSHPDSADALLDGLITTLEAIYLDPDDSVHLAVTFDDDPAQDIQRLLTRYSFFLPDEVEKVEHDMSMQWR